MLGVVASVALLATPGNVAAEKTTAAMLEFCEAALSITKGAAHGAEIGPGGYCLGFIDGVVNATQLYRGVAIQGGIGWHGGCWPAEFLLADYVKVFARYATAHPEFMQQPASWTALPAFNDTWPCP